MIGEYGTDWRGWRRDQDPFLRGWRQGLWAGALSGAVGTSPSWWWEDIHAENDDTIYRSLTEVLAQSGWGTGAGSRLMFQTAGDPPVSVGQPVAGGQPFTVTARLLD